MAFYKKQGNTVNDIGIVVLPDGKPLFISVLVSHGKEPKAKTEKMNRPSLENSMGTLFVRQSRHRQPLTIYLTP